MGSVPGRADPKGAWTSEEDQLAQMMELFGPIPASPRERGPQSSKYFDADGKRCLKECAIDSHIDGRQSTTHQTAISMFTREPF